MGGGLQREEDVTAPGGLVAGAVECQVLGAKANLCRETSFGRTKVANACSEMPGGLHAWQRTATVNVISPRLVQP